MLAAVLLLALHAPRPLTPAKPAAPPSPVGEWVIEWQGGEGPCAFSPDGGFCCVWLERFWVGTWTLDKGVLTVDEHVPAADEWGRAGERCVWKATLEPGKLEGPLDGGGRFKLRKR